MWFKFQDLDWGETYSFPYLLDSIYNDSLIIFKRAMSGCDDVYIKVPLDKRNIIMDDISVDIYINAHDPHKTKKLLPSFENYEIMKLY